MQRSNWSRVGKGLLALSAALLLTGLAGCGHNDKATDGLGSQQPPPLAAVAAPAAPPQDRYVDPAVILARRGSVATTLIRYGDEPFLKDASVTIDSVNRRCTLPAPAADRSWALFRFSDLVSADLPNLLRTSLAQPATGNQQLWVAWSDYGPPPGQPPVWRWQSAAILTSGEYAFSLPLLSPPAQPVSPGGNAYCLVATRNGAAATVSSVSLDLDCGAPPPVNLIASAGTTAGGIKLTWAAPGGTPPDNYKIERSLTGPAGPFSALITTVDGSIVQYVDLADMDTVGYEQYVYYRARSQVGARLGPYGPLAAGWRGPKWTVMTVEGNPAQNAGGQVSLHVFASGKPAIASNEGGATHKLTYFWTASTKPTDGSDWVAGNAYTSNERSGLDVNDAISLVEVNGLPGIAFPDGQNGAPSLNFARANSLTPTSAGDWSVTLTEGFGATQWSGWGLSSELIENDSKAAICYGSVPGGSLRYIRTDQADAGGSWVGTHLVQSSVNLARRSSLLRLASGRPAIAFCTDSTGSDGTLKLIKATSVTPTGAGSWDTAQVLDDTNDAGFSISSALTAGSQCPIIAYACGPNNGLNHDMRIAIASNNNPNTADWATYNVGSCCTTVSLAIVGGRPCLAYYDISATALRCAWSDVAEPNAPSDWQTFYVYGDPANDAGASCSIAALGGWPAIAFYVKRADGDLCFARAE